jgi:nucleoside-diphosphate-sugar epimerase
MADKNQQVVLITGGSGFLGKNIVKELLASSCPFYPLEIRVFDQYSYSGIEDERVTFIQGDIRNYNELELACKNATVVIHTAALIDWGTKPPDEILAVNVGGTENIIKACLKNKVPNLVYTSSLDAVFTGQPLVDIDESQSYPAKPKNSYCESKILGEKHVMEATSKDLKTCILRPSDIYGEQDPYHIDSLIDMAKSGFYIRLGNGKAKCQHVYVGNMAHAHVLAANALLQNNKTILGKAYLITDGPGENFFTFFDQIVIGAGYRIFPKNLWLPKSIAYALASIFEFISWLLRPIKKYYPKFSRFAVIYTCNNFTFNTNRAKTDFGWIPRYSTEEAVEKTIRYYKGKKEE